MNTFAGRFDYIEPRVLRRECGGWLAVSPPGAEIRIGAIGITAESARERFRNELREWARLLEEPESAPK